LVFVHIRAARLAPGRPLVKADLAHAAKKGASRFLASAPDRCGP